MKTTSDIEKIDNKSNTASLIAWLEGAIIDQIIMNEYIRDIKIIEENESEVKILVDNDYILQELEKEYLNLINEGIYQILGKKKIVTLINKETINNIKEIKNVKITEEFQKPKHIFLGTEFTSRNNLLPRLTFDKFVSADFNKELTKVSKILLNNDEVFYSPLFVHSDSGLGKTHFLHALGNAFVQKGKSVYYINPDIFTKYITNNIMNKDTEKLNEMVYFLNSIDVILFDDIQMYRNKTATLSIIFNIVDSHIQARKQIVIAADKHPKELGGFEDRFITRFSSGLTLEIQHPSTQDLIEVLKFKIKDANLRIESWEDESLMFLARNFDKSIRELEGAINRVKFHAEEDDKNIRYTQIVVNNIFKSLRQNKEDITPDRILKYVGDYYKLKPSEITSKSRKQNIVIARNVAMWLMKNELFLTYEKIGNIFGGKDHSTVISSVKKINNSMKIKNEVKYALNKISENIKKIT